MLRQHLGCEVSLHSPVLLKDGARALVIRCQVNGPRPDVASVIIKQVKPVPEAACVYTDWASLSFLSQFPVTRGLAPRFYGGDVDAGFFVMEDLGGSRSLDDVLRGEDAGAARSALMRLAVQTARLQAGTLGCAAQFEQRRSALPPSTFPTRHKETERWLAGRGRIDDWFAAASCTLPAGFDASLSRIASVFAEPGPFLAFTHGDPAPTNNHVAGDEVRLLDFEYGGFRHALYDITAWYVLCPLPERMVKEISRCYQVELARACAAARDEARYEEAWADLCAYRGLWMLAWFPCAILMQDRPRVGEWTCRQAMLSTLSRLHQACADRQGLEAVAEAATTLRSALRSRWPECGDVLPRWPALRSLQEE